MKRKRDEGYALVFALVVLLVLSIVGMTIMGLTYRDLKNQQDSIDRMKNQYEVQGKIEQIIGRLENNAVTTPLAAIFGVTPEYSNTEAIVGETSAITATLRFSSDNSGAEKVKVTIECTLKLSAAGTGTFLSDGAGGFELSGPCKVEYLSYKVTSENISEGGGS